MKKFLAIALLFAVACAKRETQAPAKTAASPSSEPATTASVAPPDVGTAMPEFKAQWLDGSTFDLASQKGSVVLLNIWATWCGPCRFEIPELDKLHRSYESRGFKVIGISVDEGGAKDVQPFVTAQKMSYPIVLDPDGKLATMLQTTVIPTSVLIDRKGNVVWKHFGIVSTSDPLLDRALQTALSAKSG